MSSGLTRLRVSNYRALAEIDLPLGPINVFFGPNGAGKSTILDALWFARDCAARGVSTASSERDHGIGLLYDGAAEGSPVTVSLSTQTATYELTLEFAAGRIDPLAGERLTLDLNGRTLIRRLPGTARATFFREADGQSDTVELREPERLSLSRFLDQDPRPEAAEVDRSLRLTRHHHARGFNLYALKKYGSERGNETSLFPRANNLWSVLANLQLKARVDERHRTIVSYMRRAFPDSFDDVVLEPTGQGSIYAQFLEKGRSRPIHASGVSDGHLALLILLTALFSEGPDRPSVLLLDEPKTSLHPWAIAVLAEAMTEAAERWNKQILAATHSPVLLSQFRPDWLFVVEPRDGRVRPTRLDEIEDVRDLLEHYAVGSLYMSEAVGRQSDGHLPTDCSSDVTR